MKNLLTMVFALLALTAAVNAQTKKPAAGKTPATALAMKNERDSLSYAIGVQVANTLKSQSIDVNTEALMRGLEDMLKGGPLAMTEMDIQSVVGAAQQRAMARQQAEASKAGEANLRAGQAFLAENKKRKGVITTQSGLQYEVLTEGTGRQPTDTSTVQVHYTGTLIDGKVFDSSIERGEPISFPVRGVIAGWTEALKLMKEGAVWKLYIPSALAYGEQGPGPIGPNAVLIFEVRLLKVE